MSLAPGVRLGSYDVIAKIGEGGMGAVYRAHDARLRRDVALKVLPDGLARDPDRLARFQREAHVLAALNHSNIAHLYGLEDAADGRVLVMELVEGPTLADRIARGPIPLDDSLKIARQIADALEAAHEQGIVHRDLKPANIKVRDDDAVKVLDFGLAKALESPGASRDVADSPTITSPAMTERGVVLGTAAYMAPEQARGKAVDKRADIWAFGVVLYEMLTGRRLFDADNISETLAAVLTRDVTSSSLPAAIPARLRALVRDCLVRDPRQRLRDIGDARLVLDKIIAGAPDDAAATPVAAAAPPQPVWRRVTWWLLAAAAGSGLTLAAVWALRPAAPRVGVVRFSINLPAGLSGANRRYVAISPDGSRIAYLRGGRLFTQALSESEARPVRGADTDEQKSSPTFSPDGQSIAYWSNRSIVSIPLTGGTPRSICMTDQNPYAISWSPAGIVFTRSRLPDRIYRVVPGGEPEVLVEGNPDEWFDSPQLLADRDTLIFSANSASPNPDSWNRATIFAYSLKNGSRTPIVSGGSASVYLPTGHLVYAIGGTLYAVAFDARNPARNNQATPIIDGVRRGWTGNSAAAQFSISANGTAIYVPGPPGIGASKFDIALSDRTGAIMPLNLQPGMYEYPRVSPDGTRITFDSDDGKEARVWVYPLDGTTSMHELTGGGQNRYPIWADNRRIAFQSNREGEAAVWWQPADGTGVAQRLTTPEASTSHIPDSWAPDGETLAYTVVSGSTFSLWTYSVRERKSAPFGGVQSSLLPTAVFSPDGRWIAYALDEGPRNQTQIFVQPFPATGTVYKLYAKAGDSPHHPLWSRDGTELFYVPRFAGLEAVSVTSKQALIFGQPTPVPRPFPAAAVQTPRTFDVGNDGRLVSVVVTGFQTTAASDSSTIQVVLNWFDELKKLAPVSR